MVLEEFMWCYYNGNIKPETNNSEQRKVIGFYNYFITCPEKYLIANNEIQQIALKYAVRKRDNLLI